MVVIAGGRLGVSTAAVHVVATAVLVVDIGRKAVDGVAIAVAEAAEAITATGDGSIVVVDVKCAAHVVVVVDGR